MTEKSFVKLGGRCSLNEDLLEEARKHGMKTEEVLSHLTDEDKKVYCSTCSDIECKNHGKYK